MARAAAPLELRVLAGPQAGARAPLATLSGGGACRIGAGAVKALPGVPGEAPDILLHSAQAFMVQIDWPAGAELAQLCVLDGAGRLGDTALASGARQAWPMRQPLTLGEVVLAYGPADEADWARHSAADPAQAPAPAPAPAAIPPRPGLERWLLTGGAALVVACIGLLFMVDLLSPAQAGLSTAGAPALPLARGAGAAGADAEAKAHSVAEIFRLHGVAAQAQARPDGTVAVTAKERDLWRVEQAEKAARRDVPGLAGLVVRNQPPPVAAAPAAPLAADAGKRITAVVDNAETPYFVTADGSRYFIGALLPSGHRVLQIAGQAVTVERGGQLTRLTL
jgi:hypothetical protein